LKIYSYGEPRKILNAQCSIFNAQINESVLRRLLTSKNNEKLKNEK